MEEKINRLDYLKIYPNYLDKDAKIAEGRKTNLDLSVSNPSIKEIFYICKTLGFECEIENKHYSKDWMKRGRVNVKFFINSNEPVNSSFTTSKYF